MRILGLVCVVSSMLVACGGPLSGNTGTEEQAPLGTVTAAFATNVSRPGVNSCIGTELVSGYVCSPSTPLACTPYNRTGCTTPDYSTDDNYTVCAEVCLSGYYATQYQNTNYCRTDASPSIRTSCYHPGSTLRRFTICGDACPNNLTATPKGYNAACDLACQQGTGSCSTAGRPSNSVECSVPPNP